MTVWVSVRPTFSNEGTSFYLPRLEPQESSLAESGNTIRTLSSAPTGGCCKRCRNLQLTFAPRGRKQQRLLNFGGASVHQTTRHPISSSKAMVREQHGNGTPKPQRRSSVLAHQKNRKRKKKAKRAGLFLLKKSNDISDCTPACPEPVEQWAAASSDREYSVSKHGSSHTALRPSSPC